MSSPILVNGVLCKIWRAIVDRKAEFKSSAEMDESLAAERVIVESIVTANPSVGTRKLVALYNEHSNSGFKIALRPQ